jgi:hypothetical protein
VRPELAARHVCCAKGNDLMKSWMKWIGLAFGGLVATSAIAADHAEAPGVTAADIADLYAWAPGGTDNLVLIQTLVGDFAENTQYVFHVARSDAAILAPPASWTNVICTFDANQAISCWAGDPANGGDYVAGDASGNEGITSTAGTLKVHAGTHADPFYFYLTGFTQARDAVVAATGLTFDNAGCPDLPPATVNALQGLLDGSVSGPAVNNFETNNVSALVVELDKTLIAGAGEHFAIYASTRSAN